ncbi:heat shock protein 70 kDa 12A [Ceratobasidium sp. AG-Ba]|nr:heat shock protein 70 kDa 12A [Ceratobasidium sp. AG-Ba]QRW06046.1 heat shock protein 70 kDa 12A [Ceratobasidium sp. AG-Ba]
MSLSSLTALLRVWLKKSKLIVGIDIGTTCSAVSYIHLTSGVKPSVQRVTKWPGQVESEQMCKVPSWIWYGIDNKPVRYGAEAFNQDPEAARRQGFFLAKHFKLHLHPSNMAPASGFKLDPLPPGIQVGQVYADIFRYLFHHTRAFFQDTTFLGEQEWETLSDTMEVIIAHPNGWWTREHGVLRSAATKGGWSTICRAHKQINFVTEAEASIQFCLDDSRTSAVLSPSNFQRNMNIIVCDAGGSTVDTTVYKVTATEPMLELKEIRSSACVQAGAIFVDDAFEDHVKCKLQSQDLDEEEVETYTSDSLEHFSMFAKRNFQGTENLIEVKMGKRKLSIPSIGVQSGYIQLRGAIVKSLFDVCVSRIIPSVTAQSSGVNSPHLFLVGGFGDSPYLKTVMKNKLNISGRLTTSNKPGAKAVADGAAIWAIARSVVSRVTRYSFGTDYLVPYDEENPDHRGREKTYLPSGELVVSDGWSEIVAKETSLSYDSSHRRSYHVQYHTFHSASKRISASIYSTTQPASAAFIMDGLGNLLPGWSHVCDVSAQVQDVGGMLVRHDSASTGSYWVLRYRIGIRFGGTELTAFIEWDENGKKMTGPATVIPTPFK